MSPKRFKHIVRRELATLRRQALISAEQYTALLQRYPATRWDWLSLARWFVFFGAVSCAAGVTMLGARIFEPSLENLAIALVVGVSGVFYGAKRLGQRGLLWSRRSLELLGGLGLIGLTFTLGLIFASGSGNWPLLLLIDLIVLIPLAYALRNVLLLVLSVIMFFTWFGGITGFVSGWGAYFFGMNYPVRFLLVGLLMIAFAAAHRAAETGLLRRYDGFFKVWLSGGVFFAEMALWLTSLFGNFGRIGGGHRESAGELLLFNLLWLSFNAAALLAGTRFQVRMLRGYAITFFVIQAYTLYFWKIAGHLGPVFSTFFAGVVTLGLVVQLEQRRRAGR